MATRSKEYIYIYIAARLLGLRVRIQPRYGCQFLLNVVCCQVSLSATGLSLVQRIPTECVCVCVVCVGGCVCH